MIVFLTFWQALLLPGTSTKRKPPEIRTVFGDAGFPDEALSAAARQHFEMGGAAVVFFFFLFTCMEKYI